jgi:hypothetical protein
MTDQPEAPIFEYKLPGSGVRLYPNRIESWKLGFMGMKRTTVPLRSVTAVDKGVTGKVTVTTADGRRHDYPTGFKAGELRDAILKLL